MRGDIGGFNVGSRYTWQMLGLIDFKPLKYMSLFAGGRALDVDYADGSGVEKFIYSARMYGPIMALNFTW